MDPYRQIGFTLGIDLVGLIKAKGQEESHYRAGEPNDEMYMKQAEYFLKRGHCQQAVSFLIKSLTMNPESKVSPNFFFLNCVFKIAFEIPLFH